MVILRFINRDFPLKTDDLCGIKDEDWSPMDLIHLDEEIEESGGGDKDEDEVGGTA